MYRPEFAYSTPPGCLDKDFTYLFDSSNVPLLSASISGRRIDNIPLYLERDAPFYWRGIKVGIRQMDSDGPVAYGFPNFSIRLRDCYDNDLSDGFLPATEYGFAMNPLIFNNSSLTGPCVPLGQEIYCPPGGIVLAFLIAPLTAESYYASIALYGVKRYKECRQ
jgi:hypothetical protein